VNKAHQSNPTAGNTTCDYLLKTHRLVFDLPSAIKNKAVRLQAPPSRFYLGARSGCAVHVPHSAFDFTTTFNTSCIPLTDLLVLNAFDVVSPIALVEVASEFAIGKTGTALDDLSERGHTRYQVNKHTVLVGALLAIRTSGQLSDGYGIDSFKRL
jgi:hypothetical protein